MRSNDARDLCRSRRVTVVRQDAVALPNVYRVELDGEPVGLVMRVDGGWLAARPGWRDVHDRPHRHTAVRRLFVSLPDEILQTSSPTGER